MNDYILKKIIIKYAGDACRMRILEKPPCKLIGVDGNIFSILGRVTNVLKNNYMEQEAKEVYNRVTKAHSYDEALKIVMDYVEID